jgi:hypothetical protein
MRLTKGQRFNLYATPGSAQVGRQTSHKGLGLLVEAAAIITMRLKLFGNEVLNFWNCIHAGW